MEIIDKTFELCNEIIVRDIDKFSGLGIVAYDTSKFDAKLHCDLRTNNDCCHFSIGDEKIKDYLIEISDYHNTFHDGFHMVNEQGILTHIAQYFVPAIQENLHPSCNHGVRYYSALCGSVIEGVLFTAIICSDKSIYVFRNGEIYKYLEKNMNNYSKQQESDPIGLLHRNEC